MTSKTTAQKLTKRSIAGIIQVFQCCILLEHDIADILMRLEFEDTADGLDLTQACVDEVQALFDRLGEVKVAEAKAAEATGELRQSGGGEHA